MAALLRTEKLIKKARKAGLLGKAAAARLSREKLGEELFRLAEQAQSQGWSAEVLLRAELKRRERHWREMEKRSA
jgi:hypothetical protein